MNLRMIIILPGYSLHNKDWAYEVKKNLGPDCEVLVHEWRHWPPARTSGSENLKVQRRASGSERSGSFSLNYEISEIKKEIKTEKVNIIAKSVGVAVAMELIPKISSQIEKVILCGIASVDEKERKASLKNTLIVLPVGRILCIQNEYDKFVIYKDAEKFYHSVEPKIKVISKPRSDHNYPYFEDFKKFLSS